jgi:hypothetical protein
MWASSSSISPEWLKEHCSVDCDSCDVVNLSNKTAPRSCFLLQPSLNGARLRTMVLKQLASDESGEPLKERVLLSKQLGLAREGIFYSKFGKDLGELVPVVYFSFGDMQTGVKVTLMEDLSSFVDSGRFKTIYMFFLFKNNHSSLFGPGNPNNYGRDLQACLVS